MQNWTLHWLQADGSLQPWQDRIANDIAAARKAMMAKGYALNLDILVARADETFVIPDLGIGAWASNHNMVKISCAPTSPVFEECLSEGAVQRLMVHEANHCLRYSAQSRNNTLGEAIVAEGLAGRFVQHVLGTPPEPWESGFSSAELDHWTPSRAILDRSGYDHDAWFFGTDEQPMWIG